MTSKVNGNVGTLATVLHVHVSWLYTLIMVAMGFIIIIKGLQLGVQYPYMYMYICNNTVIPLHRTTLKLVLTLLKLTLSMEQQSLSLIMELRNL